jgi:glycosyltransferase involved in cell wall biosynthesis
MEKKIVGLMNAYSAGISGGDLHFLKVFKYLTIESKAKWKAAIITSSLGVNLARKEGVRTKFLITTREKKWKNNLLFLFRVYFLRIVLGVRLIFKIDQPHLIYISSDFFPDVLPALIYKLRHPEVGLIFCFHLIVDSPWYEYYSRFLPTRKKVFKLRNLGYFLNQKFACIGARFFGEKILVMNQLDKNCLIARGIKRNKIEVIGNGVVLEEFANKGKRNKKVYDAVFLGRLVPQKGVLDLVPIWKLVLKRRENLRLLIIGDGPLTGELENRIRKEGLRKNIFLVGGKFGRAKVDFLKKAKIFIYPSWYESFGIVILEALASELPVIAYRLPIYKGIYKNAIWRVPFGNYQQFARGILKILRSRELQFRLKKEGGEIVKQFDWERIGQREEKIFEKVVG